MEKKRWLDDIKTRQHKFRIGRTLLLKHCSPKLAQTQNTKSQNQQTFFACPPPQRHQSKFFGQQQTQQTQNDGAFGNTSSPHIFKQQHSIINLSKPS